MPLRRLFLNADDYGRSTQINNAVVRSFEQGFCSNTTIMTNMPGYAEAVELAHQHRFSDRVGVHLNLCDGVPLTENVKRCSRICNKDGLFLGNNRPLLLILSTDERIALEIEIDSQINRCRKSRISLSHLDSHCHVHNEWGVTKLVIRIVREFDIKNVRLCRHQDTSSTWWKNTYRALVNMQLRKAGLAGTDFFGTIEEARRLHHQIKKPFSMEVMLHPTLDENDQIVDFFLEGALGERIAELLQDTSLKPYELNSYRQS